MVSILCLLLLGSKASAFLFELIQSIHHLLCAGVQQTMHLVRAPPPAQYKPRSDVVNPYHSGLLA